MRVIAALLLLLGAVPVFAQTSPSGTLIPPATTIIDASGAIWTLGPAVNGFNPVLKNGAPAGGAYGTKLLWTGGVIYVLGDDGNWYSWTGTTWASTGSATQPGGVTVTVATQTATAANRLMWDQDASDLATAQGYSYRTYSDGGGAVTLAGVTCAASAVAGTFTCAAPLPAYTTGSHYVQVAALNAQLLESLHSNVLTFTYATLPATPKNFRLG